MAMRPGCARAPEAVAQGLEVMVWFLMLFTMTAHPAPLMRAPITFPTQQACIDAGKANKIAHYKCSVHQEDLTHYP